MKKYLIALTTLALSTQAFARIPSVVAKVAAAAKISDTRTVVKEIENTEGNPCLPEGKSYIVDIQVKQAAFDYENSKVVYEWETVKSINVEKNGRVMEVCAE
ncbi:hypothetical protein [Bdellovibrio sp. HCB337]|uniref:hypothetical protein n=1 Tax=Bdellovibrio sp. HCB337 TaxID=3394358 RepID=UPI0039A61B5C